MDIKRSVLLFLAPDLKISGMKIAHQLLRYGGKFNEIFLAFPKEMEELVHKLADTQTTLEVFIEESKRREFIPKPIGSWLYFNKPILEALPRIKNRYPHLQIKCYGGASLEIAAMEIAVKLTTLTLRTNLTDRIQPSLWRDLIKQAEVIQIRHRAVEAENIIQRLKGRGICISDMEGRSLAKHLRKAGIKVNLRYCVSPYHFTPLKILNRIILHRSAEDWEIEQYVEAHLHYIKDYIYKFKNRDRAYYEWVNDQIPWIRGKIDEDEIKNIDRIIQ